MSNPLRYIKALEAAGVERNQAEAQVQMVLDMIENNLATKSDIANLKSEFAVFQAQIKNQIVESEFRTVTRLGLLNVSTITIAVAILTWLIKT